MRGAVDAVRGHRPARHRDRRGRGRPGAGHDRADGRARTQGRALALVPLAEHQLAVPRDRALCTRAGPACCPAGRPASRWPRWRWTACSTARGPRCRPGARAGARARRPRRRPCRWRHQAAMALLPVSFEGQPRLVAVSRRPPASTRVDGRSQRHLAVADLRSTACASERLCCSPTRPRPGSSRGLIAALAALQLGVSAGQLRARSNTSASASSSVA
jgi:hypothetical protein